MGLTPEEKRIRHRDAQRKYRAANLEKCRDTVRRSLGRYRGCMTQAQKDKRRQYRDAWQEKRGRMVNGREMTATCRECGGEFRYIYMFKERVLCDKKECRYASKLKQNREAKHRLRGAPLISYEKHGTEVTGLCRNCGNSFKYTYNRKTRFSCDACRQLNKSMPVARIPMAKLTPEQRLALRPDHAVFIKREQWMTKHDLQHAPTEDFARQVNAILSGERGLV